MLHSRADRDNKEDEFHKPLSILDTWRYYYELSQRPSDGKGKWTQERIAKAVGVKQPVVSNRLKWHNKVPQKIKEFINQFIITEKHIELITRLEADLYFSPWLTTKQLWIDIANWVVEKGKVEIEISIFCYAIVACYCSLCQP